MYKLHAMMYACLARVSTCTNETVTMDTTHIKPS